MYAIDCRVKRLVLFLQVDVTVDDVELTSTEMSNVCTPEGSNDCKCYTGFECKPFNQSFCQ